MTRPTHYAQTIERAAITHHTLTREGLIAHARLTSLDGSITLDAPVKLIPPIKGEAVPRPMLAKDRIGYVYALPGNGEWQA